MTTLFLNCRIVTPEDPGKPLSGREQGLVREYDHAAILVENGCIQALGPEVKISSLPGGRRAKKVNLQGACVIPGFVDPHTHMCFALRREEEFRMRLAGKTYLEILAQGGGILSSVRAVRECDNEHLFRMTMGNALNALCQGTTTVEIKSGYGLDTETELRMLRVIARVRRESPLDVVSTFMGAHAIPAEHKKNPQLFVRAIIKEMLPAVVRENLASFCDVFCETGVFSLEQSREIMEAAERLGLALKIHADEVNDLGGAALAAEMKAVTAEHLLAASPEGLAAMAESGTIAVLLPGTAYSLGKPYANAKRMQQLGVPIALATDCNPGSCFCENMAFVMGLAVLAMGMTPEEALVGCTLNAAYAVNMADKVGSLEPGKAADFLVLDGRTPAAIPYHAGGRSVTRVYKGGVLVAKNGQYCQ